MRPKTANLVTFTEKFLNRNPQFLWSASFRRTVKHLEDDCTHNLVLFQNLFMKEMEGIEQFTKSTE